MRDTLTRFLLVAVGPADLYGPCQRLPGSNCAPHALTYGSRQALHS